MATCLGRHDRPTPDLHQTDRVTWGGEVAPHVLWMHHLIGMSEPKIFVGIYFETFENQVRNHQHI